MPLYKFRYVTSAKSIMERLCAVNTATLSTRAHLAPKASTKHLESRLEVTQGHAFWSDDGLRIVI